MDLKKFLHKTSTNMRLELVLLSVIFTAALAAGYVLFILRADHQRDAHHAATESVIDQGDQLLKAMVYHTKFYCSTNPSPEQWRNFSALIDRILAVRNDIQSISMRNGDLTVFHRQSENHAYQHQNEETQKAESTRTLVARETIDIGGKKEPVFVFTRRTSDDPGNEMVLEATFRQSSVTEREEIAKRMINSLFTFSLSVLVISLLLCAAVLVAAIIRDRHRQEVSHQEEHLTFSGVMANGILHDFRNPMSAVRLDAQMLERETARTEGMRPERVRDLSARIARTMTRMDKIFAEFLYLAKPSDELPAPLDIRAAVDECIDILEPRLEQANLQIVKEISENLPQISAHHFAIKRSLLNVLMNSIHFAPAASSIIITAEEHERHLVLEISDEGPGIPIRKRKEIFKLFVTGRPEGTGLGLFLAKTAINRCHGTIEAVDSRRTRGATIRITLPLINQINAEAKHC